MVKTYRKIRLVPFTCFPVRRRGRVTWSLGFRGRILISTCIRSTCITAAVLSGLRVLIIIIPERQRIPGRCCPKHWRFNGWVGSASETSSAGDHAARKEKEKQSND